MHDAVTMPKQVKKASEVEKALDDWELELSEYYRCGGDVLAENTKIRTAMKLLPPAPEIGPEVHLRLKNILEMRGSYYQWLSLIHI